MRVILAPRRAAAIAVDLLAKGHASRATLGIPLGAH